MREEVVDNLIKKAFIEAGDEGWYHKVQSNKYAKTGVPDFLGSYQGRFLGIEAKAGNGHKLGYAQLYNGLDIVRSGGIFIVAYPDFLDLPTSLLFAEEINAKEILEGSNNAVTLRKSNLATFEDLAKTIENEKKTRIFTQKG